MTPSKASGCPRATRPKVNLHSMFVGLSGAFDDYVYKTIRGRVFLSKKPVFRRRKWSAKQRDGHARLKEAAAYANAVWADPERKAFYVALARKRKAWRAYSLASGDFLNAPEIGGVKWELEGEGGAVVWIEASDDVEVVRVEVVVRSAGRVVVRGEASLTKGGRWRWAADRWPRSKLEVEVTAVDRPGNRTMVRQESSGIPITR